MRSFPEKPSNVFPISHSHDLTAVADRPPIVTGGVWEPGPGAGAQQYQLPQARAWKLALLLSVALWVGIWWIVSHIVDAILSLGVPV